MQILQILIPTFNLLLIIGTVFIIFYYTNRRIYRNDVFNRFAEVLTVLEQSKETSYNKIFRDDILTMDSLYESRA